MIAHGVFDRFPSLRVAFLEGGAAWVPFLMDRFDRSYHDGHKQLDLDGELIGGPKEGEKASDYFKLTRQDKEAVLGGNAFKFYCPAL